MAELPLLRRFPALARLARAELGRFPTPVERVAFADGRVLLVKRDDLTADQVGGNKVRGLEWLLGGLLNTDRVLTVGPRGSTHALATAHHARRLGASTSVVRWDQHMNAAACRVEARTRREARVIDARWVPAAYALATALRVRGARWIPAGGAEPLALLGHVNAALELREQVESGVCGAPARVVVPLGTGGTAAGLALGFRIAGVYCPVIAVRVVPRLVGRRGRVLRLANAAAALLERASGERVPRVGPEDVGVEHAYYGGAYGRPLPAPIASADHETLAAAGIGTDDTYSAKALAAAMAMPRDTLLWLTFDGRLLQD